MKSRFFLRLHMFWILSGTFLAGLATTKLLFELQLNVLALRYLIAVGIAYLAFLALIRMWLWYVGLSVRPPADVDVDVFEIPVRLLSHLGPGEPPAIHGGGEFGGGGATGSWGDAVADVEASSAASAILGEAAFEAALAAALARSARRIDRPGWVGRVWRATIWPFVGVLILAGVLGWAAQHYCPSAIRLRDALHCAVI